MSRVAVCGAGIIGLTTARALQKKGVDVIVVSKSHGAMTTSAVAGGYWMPFHCEPADKVSQWSRDTLEIYKADAARNSLIEKMPAFCLFATPEAPPPPDWGRAANLQLIHGRDSLEEAMKISGGLVAPKGYTAAWLFETVVVDAPKYLTALEQELADNGATLHLDGFDIEGKDFSRIAQELQCDTIVNCTGLNGDDLAKDEGALLTPGRGAVAYYQRPADALKAVVTADSGPLAPSDSTPAYCIPRGDVVVVGGSYNLGAYNLDVASTEVDRLKANASTFSPLHLADAEPVRVAAGLRPVRGAGVRLQLATTQEGISIAHNYGHGGSGWTTAWGCAHELADMILSAPP